MIDKFIYSFFGALDKVSGFIDKLFTPKRQKKRK
jgi:hypothetical protein|tara:strand:+ start:489 stop:590 length:102 start_codon:yes stop_codon:yes gene_type:complete